MNQFKLKRKFDPSIPTTGIILSLFGLVMILSASQIVAANNFGSQYYFFIRQLFSWVVGIFVFFYFLRVPLDKLYSQRNNYLLVTIVLLIIVLIFGPRVANVHRWIDLGFFRFQPAEFAKLFLTIYLAGWFASKGDRLQKPQEGLLPFAGLLALVVGLVMLEPDMGTALVIVVLAMTLLFVARLNIFQYISIILVAVVALVGLIFAAPYRLERLTTFLNKDSAAATQSALDSAYHNQQALIAIGSGGWWGVGFGQGVSKYAYLPQAYTDSVFAIMAEELGFIRASLVLAAFMYLAWRGFRVARKANSLFVQLLAAGISTVLVAQALINIGGMLSVIPLTGVPLPFISYGGSSLVVCLGMLGLLTNASRETRD